MTIWFAFMEPESSVDGSHKAMLELYKRLTMKSFAHRKGSEKISGWCSAYPAPNGVARLFRFGWNSGFAKEDLVNGRVHRFLQIQDELSQNYMTIRSTKQFRDLSNPKCFIVIEHFTKERGGIGMYLAYISDRINAKNIFIFLAC